MLTGRRAHLVGTAVVVTVWLTLWSGALIIRPSMHSMLPGHIAVARIDAAWGVARAIKTVRDPTDIQRLVSAIDADLSHPIGGAAADDCMNVSYGALIEFWPGDRTDASGHVRPSGSPMVVGVGMCGDIYVVGRIAGGRTTTGREIAIHLPRLAHGKEWTALGDRANLFAVAQEMAGFTQ